LKDLPEEDIERNMGIIWRNIPHTIPHIPWEIIHDYGWGPYEGEMELYRQMKGQYRRKYKW
jgi:hypothetical protein